MPLLWNRVVGVVQQTRDVTVLWYMHIPSVIWSTLIATLIVGLSGCAAPKPGTISDYAFSNSGLNEGRSIRVYYYKPLSYQTGNPILFVIHGNSRNPIPYCEAWVQEAEASGALIVCPDFARDNGFPTSDEFNLGNVFVLDRQDRVLGPVSEADWSFSLIEPIFEDIRQKVGSMVEDYKIFGHSAGAQFVHRFLIFKPNARVSQAVVANAGWYTLPVSTENFPYGLGGTGYDEALLAVLFNRDFTILLGDQDTDPKGRNLRQTPEARIQGPHRYARGKHFYQLARTVADENGWKFNWRLESVPGIGHDQSGMVPAAAQILLETQVEE